MLSSSEFLHEECKVFDMFSTLPRSLLCCFPDYPMLPLPETKNEGNSKMSEKGQNRKSEGGLVERLLQSIEIPAGNRPETPQVEPGMTDIPHSTLGAPYASNPHPSLLSLRVRSAGPGGTTVRHSNGDQMLVFSTEDE